MVGIIGVRRSDCQRTQRAIALAASGHPAENATMRTGFALLVFAMLTASLPAEEWRPALIVEPVRPDVQLARVLALFEGSRAAHPAAALAAWKRATGGRQTMGKSWEAVIAAFNPEMVRELRVLDGSVFALALNEQRGWYAVVPEDDGAFAALATALVLTDGASESPLGLVPVDRLGRAGSPVLARAGRGVALGATRDDLERALELLHANPRVGPPSIETGWVIRLDPDALGSSADLNRARCAAGLRGLGCRALQGTVALEGDSVMAVVTGRYAGPALAGEPLDPAWLDVIPSANTLVAVSVALDPRPEVWDTIFTVADRVEKADPTRSKTALLRTRLNLLALGVRVRAEVEIWPRLRGITAWVTAAHAGRVDGALLALHTPDEGAAEALVRDVLPRLATLLRSEDEPIPASGRRSTIAGRPLLTHRRGKTVLLAWGEASLRAGLDAAEHPASSAGPLLRAALDDRPLQRAGAFWPGRLVPDTSSLAGTLAVAPPVIWRGTNDGPITRDVFRLDGLRAVVRQFLEWLPGDPTAEEARSLR
jgi:hypothetical protein